MTSPMTLRLVLSAAALTLSAGAIAQTATPAPPPAGNDMSAAQMPQSGMPTPPADPNAAVPAGAVPADTGMTPATPGVPQDPAAPVGTSPNPVVVGGNATPPAPTPQSYPKCSKTVQDSCINSGEAKGKAMRKKRG
ncbi:hypothetical protein BH10PSE12_BH10PSE12_22320 [soil metagenome]